MRSRWIKVVLMVAVIILSPCLLLVGWFVSERSYVRNHVWTEEDRAHTGPDGLPSDARKWSEVIESVPDIEAAKDHPELSRSPYYFEFRFKNDEWVFGIAVDSHGQIFSKGGTVVLKDCRGKVRIFFGHVCGPQGGGMPGYAASLDDWYDWMQNKNGTFREYFLDP